MARWYDWTPEEVEKKTVLGAQNSGANLTPEAAVFPHANKLGAGLATVGAVIFSFVVKKYF
jgi:hypothetical protein